MSFASGLMVALGYVAVTLAMAATCTPDVMAMMFGMAGMDRLLLFRQERRWGVGLASGLLLAAAVLHAQPAAEVRGTVVDARGGEALHAPQLVGVQLALGGHRRAAPEDNVRRQPHARDGERQLHGQIDRQLELLKNNGNPLLVQAAGQLREAFEAGQLQAHRAAAGVDL